MSEITTIVAVVVVGCAVFGAVWLIVQDAKNSAHARIQRCEHVVDGIISACALKKEEFITIKGFDRFERNLNTRFDGLDKGVGHLTQRIDDLVLTVRNGNGKIK